MRKLLIIVLRILGVFLSEKNVFFFKRIKVFIISQTIATWFKKADRVISISPPFIIRGAKYITLGKNFVTKERLRIEAVDSYMGNKYQPNIKIGDNVSFNTDCHIGSIIGVTIGNNVVLASRIFITDHFHGDSSMDSLEIPVAERELFSKGEVKVGNNVWIGEGVVILPGVTIGDNCVIGANSVVNKSFPSNTIIAGVPAKSVIK